MTVAEELGKLYRRWAELAKVYTDRTQPLKIRLDCLNQVNHEMGVPLVTDENELEAMTDEYLQYVE